MTAKCRAAINSRADKLAMLKDLPQAVVQFRNVAEPESGQGIVPLGQFK